MKQKKLKELKKNEWFTLKPIEEPTESQVYIKGEYDRTDKKYECGKWNDVYNTRWFKGDKTVYVDFIF